MAHRIRLQDLDFDPVPVAAAVLVAGLTSMISLDLASAGLPSGGAWAILRAMLMMLVATISLVYLVVALMYAGFRAGGWMRGDVRGLLTVAAAIGIVAVLVQLQGLADGRQSFLQAVAGVLAATYIALAMPGGSARAATSSPDGTVLSEAQ